MLIGLPPIGSPPEWGKTMRYAIDHDLVDPDLCSGRFVSVVVNKASYTGVVISVNSSGVIVYVDQPRQDIVERSLDDCTFVTVTGKKRASDKLMQDITRYARSRGVVA